MRRITIKQSDIKQKNKLLQDRLKKYFRTRYILLGVIAILLFALFGDFIKTLILIAIFVPLIVWTMKVSQFIPHVNIELLSASTLLMGFVSGPMVALIFGLVAGLFGAIKANQVKYLMLVRIIIIALVGFGLSFFSIADFNLFFIAGIIIMNIIAYFVYLVLDPDPFQNMTHRVSHLFWNLFVVRFLFLALYGFIR